MKKVYELLVKISDIVFMVEKWILLAAVIVAVAVNFLNVCLRYILNSGLNYCETLSICLFMFMVVVGSNIAAKTDGEIKIEIIKFKDTRKNSAYRLIADAVSIAAIIFCIIGIKDTIASVSMYPQKVTPLPIYTYHIYMVMAVGFVMTLLDHIIILICHAMQAAGIEVEGGCKTS
ncbi:MAG: TRAP transporter small permease subunit [Eubacteriales bacterium]|nr:TRAP transporter small permease subunit [Eubacteriales bacterium]